MLSLRALSFATLAPAALLLAQGQPAPTRSDVPVRTVVLFSSGVGYFEHAGIVRGSGTTEIRFRATQINDVLKSLVLHDQDGGHVTAITYPSQDPVAKALRSFQVDITANPSLSELLNQVRGARATVQIAAERISGTILGVEVRRRAVDKGEPISSPILNLLAGSTIRSIDLQMVRGISLDDARLEDELAKALATLSQARDQDKKPVTIGFSGTGERRLRVGYVVESPVWKTSYRLLLDSAAPRLQGWAIVENQTESDWNGVSLSLVSGRPISFTMDLYRPLYASRPSVAPATYAALRPQVYDTGISDSVERVTLAKGAEAAARYGASATNGAFTLSQVVTTGTGASTQRTLGFAVSALHADAGERTSPNPLRTESTVRSVAAASRLGELFQYVVPNVTLARQKSAMLPIVADSVRAERFSIYNASVLRTNPLNGVRLTNTTGKHLQQGPITVMDGGGYAGDARIDDIPPGQSRLLSFGIDLDITVDNGGYADTTAVLSARISGGVIVLQRRRVLAREYVAENKGDRDKRLLIEHPVRDGWTLVDTRKPVETTAATYRFEGTAPAHKIATLVVKEQRVDDEEVEIVPADADVLLFYARARELPAPVREALARAAQLKQLLADIERDVRDRTTRIGEINAEQGRIRENMKTVAVGTDYYKRLLAKLNEQESAIERLQRERTELTSRRDAKQKELETYVAGLTIG